MEQRMKVSLRLTQNAHRTPEGNWITYDGQEVVPTLWLTVAYAFMEFFVWQPRKDRIARLFRDVRVRKTALEWALRNARDSTESRVVTDAADEYIGWLIDPR